MRLVSIYAGAATPTTLALALLRKASHPLRPKEWLEWFGKSSTMSRPAACTTSGFDWKKKRPY